MILTSACSSRRLFPICLAFCPQRESGGSPFCANRGGRSSGGRRRFDLFADIVEQSIDELHGVFAAELAGDFERFVDDHRRRGSRVGGAARRFPGGGRCGLQPPCVPGASAGPQYGCASRFPQSLPRFLGTGCWRLRPADRPFLGGRLLDQNNSWTFAGASRPMSHWNSICNAHSRAFSSRGHG